MLLFQHVFHTRKEFFLMTRNHNKSTSTLLIGLILFAIGFFILAQHVHVGSNYFSRFRLSGGLVILPLILGIIWYVVNQSKIARLVIVLSIIFIIVYIIMNTSIYLTYMTLYDWLLIIGLMSIGLGFMVKYWLS